jgi:DNA repair protein RadC
MSFSKNSQLTPAHAVQSPEVAYFHSRPIRDIPLADRPQERLEQNGVRSLTDKELLAMILRSGQKGRDVLTVAQSLLDAAGSLSGLSNWQVEDYMAVKGIGKVKALQLIVVLEIHRRCLSADGSDEAVFDNPEVVSRYLNALAHGLEVEKFWTLCLNRKNRLIKQIEVTSGTATASLVHPREVFREAIRVGAAAIIVAHNHPSGDPAPSRADIQVTRQLREAAKTIGIDLLDHVIIGNKGKDPAQLGYYSFNDGGLI